MDLSGGDLRFGNGFGLVVWYSCMRTCNGVLAFPALTPRAVACLSLAPGCRFFICEMRLELELLILLVVTHHSSQRRPR